MDIVGGVLEPTGVGNEGVCGLSEESTSRGAEVSSAIVKKFVESVMRFIWGAPE